MKRLTTGGAAVLVLLALGACSESGSDDDGGGSGGFLGDQGGTTGGGTTGGTIGGGTTGTTGGGQEPTFQFDCNGTTIVAGPGDTISCDGQTFTVDASGTATPVGGTTGGTTGTTGGGQEPTFQFDCNGTTIVAGPGDTISCNGQSFTVDASGTATPVGGTTGGTGGGGQQFEYTCGDDTIIAGPGDTVVCNGTTFQIQEDGTPVEVGGGGGGGGDVAALLINRFVSADDFDAWGCTASGQSFNVGYVFPTPNQGVYLQLIENGDVFGFDYSVSGTTASLSLENGQQETISGIAFADTRAWTGTSSLHGGLNCQLVEIRP